MRKEQRFLPFNVDSPNIKCSFHAELRQDHILWYWKTFSHERHFVIGINKSNGKTSHLPNALFVTLSKTFRKLKTI